jgi:hypothetical protein
LKSCFALKLLFFMLLEELTSYVKNVMCTFRDWEEP